MSIPMAYPRIATGLEYKENHSYCPQGGKRDRNPIRCNWKKLD